MFGRMFGNPVLNRSNEKDRVREGGYFSIPLQREHQGAEYLHETYREIMILALLLSVIALLVSGVAALIGAIGTRDISAALALALFAATIYLAVDRIYITRQVALDVHSDRSKERETFQSTENMYSVALAHYLRFKEGQPYDIKMLELFAKYQADLLSTGNTGFEYKEGK